ncbi:hypothetical protein BSI_22100 [Bacillus inaquosorum KCTC 13429]|uniref:Uncharacterized protein n=1 Tax=Bacillus inaquosorum KCTC 13429 TaxID=1236548 RepID=A0A9W5LHG5_9BACI|nr:hypothetical protein BSI_22100 [Bacillus inaquosorum KCTC 13429]
MLLSLIRIILFLFEKHTSFDHAPFFGGEKYHHLLHTLFFYF